MAKFIGFTKGMGIGGWLTNYKRFNVLPDDRRMILTPGDMEHFSTYITERDIKYIASCGFDHIRLGFDQIVLEEKEGVYRKEIVSILKNFVSWCHKYNLNIVLNLHKAVGNYCDIKENKELLDDRELQNRFISLWLYLEDIFHDDNSIVFELMNEIRNVDPNKWNLLAEETILELRKKNKTRKIVIGGINYNDPNALLLLKVFDDPNVIYTFHTYFPFEFTHQRGVLQGDPLFYNREMHYPDKIDLYNDYQHVVHNDDNLYKGYDMMDSYLLKNSLKAVLEFKKRYPDKIIWNGEFGTIRHANIISRKRLMRDVISFCLENDISYSVWNYLSTPNDGNRFSLVDDISRKFLDDELKDICLGKLDKEHLSLVPVGYGNKYLEWKIINESKTENGFENNYYNCSYEEYKNVILPKYLLDSDGIDLPNGHVPQTNLVLYLNSEPIGIFKVRHYCNDVTRNNGAGHIGYIISPKYRGKGYATKGVKLAIDYLLSLPDYDPKDDIIMGVHKDNLASLKVQQNCGAKIIKETDDLYVTVIKINK